MMMKVGGATIHMMVCGATKVLSVIVSGNLIISVVIDVRQYIS